MTAGGATVIDTVFLRRLRMKMKSISYVFGAMTLAALFGTPAAMAQSDHTAHDHSGTTQPSAEKRGEDQGDETLQKGTMMEMHQKMMQKREQMQQHCQMMDAKLDELANAMNSAEGEAKVEAMEALINELVSQRESMHQMMMKMEGEMMPMMMGGQGDGSASMSRCKMMMEKMQKGEDAPPE